ncbi:MAG: hydratase [Treponema sp.]|nr:hydratase [Treponema sp.]
MVKICTNGVWILKGREIIEDIPENQGRLRNVSIQEGEEQKDLGRLGTMAAGILLAHHEDQGSSSAETPRTAPPRELKLKFDAMASHDITFVNIIQTAKVSGLEEFPIPYILTNCHNSLCAVGGTVNADDHLFGLSAAKRYGGVFVPPHLAVIHSYIREARTAGGRMILGSDSHTRYGSYGTMGVGEGGGELVKQLLGQSYQAPWPAVVAVNLSGKVRPGVGPQDVALAIIGAVFQGGIAKNAVLEFIGDGIESLSADFRAGIDVMTTETTSWSSIWETDETIRAFYETHHRQERFRHLFPQDLAYYDGMIYVDLGAVKPMIALPFHPSNVYDLDSLLANPGDILRKVEIDAQELMEESQVKLDLTGKIDSSGRIRVDQGVVAGCAGGTFENLMAVQSIMEEGAKLAPEEGPGGNEGFTLSVYPGSQPILLELSRNGALSSLIQKGVIVRTAFCGPCFGAGDVPAHGGLSIRHSTRNFPNREGSKPNEGQISSVALMDARSIAATALNGGFLTSIDKLDWKEERPVFHFDPLPYKEKTYNGIGKADREAPLHYGPNITDWPEMQSLDDNLLIKVISYINDPVTTTDELIPSGDTSSFRSNPVGLAEFTLSRKDPAYVGQAKAVAAGDLPELPGVLERAKAAVSEEVLARAPGIQVASGIFARKPGDGSAREQAASCQRVLGGSANFAQEYATKRYRSNLINWGIIPFIIQGEPPFQRGDYVFIPGIREALMECKQEIPAYVLKGDNAGAQNVSLYLPDLSRDEAELLLQGSLINLNRNKLKGA